MMHSLLLLRHGESADKQANQTDFDRSLTIRGRESIHRLGLHLKEKNIFPDGIISSNSIRTIQTTLELCVAMGISESVARFEPSLYNGQDEDYIKCISGFNDSVGLLMVVGHNPSISSVIGRLTDQYSQVLHAGQSALIELIHNDLRSEPLVGKLIHLIGPFMK